MKALVVYYSMSGNTEYVANKINDNLGVDLLKLVPIKEYPSKGFRKYLWGGKSAIMKDMPSLEEYQFNADEYDTIIFGTPVWASRMTPPLRTFINNHKEELKEKNIAAYACFLGSGAKETIESIKELLEIENLKTSLILIDPKNQMTEEKEKQIDEFCNQIKGE